MSNARKIQLEPFFRYFPVDPRGKSLGLYATTIGESSVSGSISYPPAVHPAMYDFAWQSGRTLSEYQIIYISDGGGALETAHTKLTKVISGDIFCIFPGEWHRYRPDPETGWVEHWIGFSGSLADGLANEQMVSRQKPIIKMRNEAQTLTTIRHLIEAVRNDEPAAEQIVAGGIFYLLSMIFAASLPLRPNNRPNHASIHKAIMMMENADNQSIPLQKIAAQANLSYSSFRREFSRLIGVSPHQYRLRLQLARSRGMLRDHSHSIKEIAALCGFQSEQYFCRLFKAKCGRTPAHFRTSEESERG